jgi:hypothetical protein
MTARRLRASVPLLLGAQVAQRPQALPVRSDHRIPTVEIDVFMD